MIYVILPVFKRVEMTARFIESVRKEGNDEVRFIIVDDEKLAYSNYTVFSGCEDVIALKTEGDVWWCRTVSMGIDYVFENIPKDILINDIIVIANNDVQIQSNTLDIMDELDDNCIMHPITKLLSTGEIISSGCRVSSWLPFITNHKVNLKESLTKVDMLTARFLCMKGSVLLKNGNISKDLLQYHGDSEFTLRASINGVENFINTNFFVTLDDNENSAINLKNITNYFKYSFNETKSTSIKQKYIFLRCNFGPAKSFLITFSMFINGFVKVFLRKFFG